MNNVVTINQKKPMFKSADSSGTKRLVETLLFAGGVLLSMVLPAIVYVQAGGPLKPAAFVAVGLVGTLIGVRIYRYPPQGPPSIIGPRSSRQSPNKLEPTMRKAA